MQFSLDDVRAVAQLLREHNLAEIAVETTEAEQPSRLVLRRAASQPALVTTSYHPAAIPIVPGIASNVEAMATESNGAASAAPANNAPLPLTATVVGVFREATPPLQVGATVRARQVIGSVESLKVPNDITAPIGGKIIEVLVEDGQGVEYGQTLMLLERAEL